MHKTVHFNIKCRKYDVLEYKETGLPQIRKACC